VLGVKGLTARPRILGRIGLVPKQNSSGGKERLGSTTKAGDRYLRSLFCASALAVVRYAKLHARIAHGLSNCSSAADQSRDDRACQQARSHGLGDHGEWRTISRARCLGEVGLGNEVNKIAPSQA
jgi:transposase